MAAACAAASRMASPHRLAVASVARGAPATSGCWREPSGAAGVLTQLDGARARCGVQPPVWRAPGRPSGSLAELLSPATPRRSAPEQRQEMIEPIKLCRRPGAVMGAASPRQRWRRCCTRDVGLSTACGLFHPARAHGCGAGRNSTVWLANAAACPSRNRRRRRPGRPPAAPRSQPSCCTLQRLSCPAQPPSLEQEQWRASLSAKPPRGPIFGPQPLLARCSAAAAPGATPGATPGRVATCDAPVAGPAPHAAAVAAALAGLALLLTTPCQPEWNGRAEARAAGRAHEHHLPLHPTPRSGPSSVVPARSPTCSCCVVQP